LPDPSEIAREAWHEALYAIERLVATFFWTLDRAILTVISLVERWRGQLVTQGFRPVIQTVADTLVTLAPGILALGFVLGLLLILLRPALNLSLVNVRKVLVYAALIPVLFPLAGATFQALEETRAEFGGWFFNTGALLVGFDLGGQGTGAPTTTMAEVVPYDPTLYNDPNVRHGIDVAAAYLYATKDDVTSARDLPAAFEQEFFPVPDLAREDATQRWERIKHAAQGVVRASFGLVLVLVALCESAINLVFTIGLGLLLIGFGVGVVLGWFSPVEAIAARMGQELIQVFIGSWGISVAQGLLIAALLAVAQTGNADAVFGMGIVAIILEGIFLVAAAKTLFNGFAGAAGALTGGTVSPQEVAAGAALAGSAMLGGGAAGYGTIRAVERGGGALASGAVSAAGGALRTGSAFRYARQLNDGTSGSTRYAIGAAMSQSPALARAGTLATLMGATQPGGHFERGLTTGVVGGRGEPLRTRAALRTDAQARTMEAFGQGIDQIKQRQMRDDQVARNISWTPSPQRATGDTQPLAPHTNVTQPLTPAAAPPAGPGGGSQRPQRRGPRAQRPQAGGGQLIQARAQQRRQQRVAAQQTQRQAAHAARWQAWQQRQQTRPPQPRRGRRFASKLRPAPVQAVDTEAPDTATEAPPMMLGEAPAAAPRPAQHRRPRHGPPTQRAQRGPGQRQPVHVRAQRPQAGAGQPIQARAQQRRQQRVAAQRTQQQAAHAQRWQAWQQRQQARPHRVSRGRRFTPKLRPAPVQAMEAVASPTTTSEEEEQE